MVILFNFKSRRYFGYTLNNELRRELYELQYTILNTGTVLLQVHTCQEEKQTWCQNRKKLW